MSDEPDTGPPTRRPTGDNTAFVQASKADLAKAKAEREAEVALAKIAADDADKARNDEIARIRALFDGLRGLLPTWKAAVVVAAIVLGLAALGWGGKLAFSAAGLGLTVGEGRPAEFDAHQMTEDGGAKP